MLTNQVFYALIQNEWRDMELQSLQVFCRDNSDEGEFQFDEYISYTLKVRVFEVANLLMNKSR
jgi:hypothetical protein